VILRPIRPRTTTSALSRVPEVIDPGRYVEGMPGYDDDLRLAHVLADAVERVTMTRFKAEDLHVDTKPDATWVSDADRTAEQVIRAQLGRTRPRRAAPLGSNSPVTWLT
jgi:histidinol-phosphatase